MVSGRRAPARETMRASDRMTYLVVWGRIPPEADRTVRSASPERTEPTPLLNHETSDHLLSLVDNERGYREPHGQCEPRATRIQVLCCGAECTILARSICTVAGPFLATKRMAWGPRRTGSSVIPGLTRNPSCRGCSDRCSRGLIPVRSRDDGYGRRGTSSRRTRATTLTAGKKTTQPLTRGNPRSRAPARPRAGAPAARCPAAPA